MLRSLYYAVVFFNQFTAIMTIYVIIENVMYSAISAMVDVCKDFDMSICKKAYPRNQLRYLDEVKTITILIKIVFRLFITSGNLVKI